MRAHPSGPNHGEKSVDTSLSQETNPSMEYVPKWHHFKEDLEYMFGIPIHDEEELYSARIKKEMYKKAVKDLLEDENPFSLDYFFENEFLSREDVQEKDFTKLRKSAVDVLGNTRNIVRRTRLKELFVVAGILTKQEADQITMIH